MISIRLLGKYHGRDSLPRTVRRPFFQEIVTRRDAEVRASKVRSRVVRFLRASRAGEIENVVVATSEMATVVAVGFRGKWRNDETPESPSAFRIPASSDLHRFYLASSRIRVATLTRASAPTTLSLFSTFLRIPFLPFQTKYTLLPFLA